LGDRPYLHKEFSEYQTEAFDLIGFGGENKPDIDYNLNDFMQFLEEKLHLSKDNDIRYIIVGHSLGSLLATAIAKKYPQKVLKVFLMGYPFLDRARMLKNRGAFDGLYVDGVWWTRIVCELRMLWKTLLIPYIFLFKYKYRKSALDYAQHTYQSALGTIHNTIFKDSKAELSQISGKIVFINGQNDMYVDLKFTDEFKHYAIPSMGHAFFDHETEIASIIKDEIQMFGISPAGNCSSFAEASA
jgi:pimeloyl-ACP methyl ester carboxylesterase